MREQTKYERIFLFAGALPRIRQRCQHDLSTSQLTREKVLALIVTLLGETSLRVGNDEYARANRSFGLSTLRDRHARVHSQSVEFHFRGKSGKDHLVKVCDARLARAVRRCQDLPGEQLFQYVDEQGERRSVGSSDVNDYLREITGAEFTAKDFRTWSGTLAAAVALSERGLVESATERAHNVKDAIARAAEKLGNTPAICRKCYIHPTIFEAYEDGRAFPAIRPPSRRRGTGLAAHERAVLRLLKRKKAR